MDEKTTQKQEPEHSENTELKLVIKVARFAPGGGALSLSRYHTPEGIATENLMIEIEDHTLQVIRYNRSNYEMVVCMDERANTASFVEAGVWLLNMLLNQPL